MKKLSTLWLLSALLVGGLVGCADKTKEFIGVDVVDPYDVTFEIEDGDVTSTSYSFTVTPSDSKSPYVCLYVDKSVIDKVPKQELPAFLVKELKKNAQAANKTWDDYLSSLLATGRITRTIKNLLPGNMYELVVFGVKGRQLSRSAGYRFFETLIADPVDMTFQVSVDNSNPRQVVLDVTPSLADVRWYFCSFPKDQYDKLKASGMRDGQMAQAYLGQEFRGFLQMNPDPTREQIEEFINSKFHIGGQKLTVRGRALKADTEYVYLLTAVYVSPSFEVVFISNTTPGSFKTAAVPQKDTTFDLKVSNITKTHASISITPSALGQAYVWRCEPLNSQTLKMTPEQHARHVIDTNPYIFFEAFPHRVVNYPTRKLVPGTKHYLMAFGYEGGICTKVYRELFDPLEAGDPKQTTFTVEKLKLTTDRAQLKITPSDESVYYIPLLYPDSESKESLKGRLIAGLRRSLDQTKGSGFNPYAELWDVISNQATLGESDFQWSNLKPGEKHTLLILTFDKKGIASDKHFEPGFLTVPGFSTETVDGMQIAGVFDGNEENGSIFNQPDMVKDKVILVLKYNISAGISEAYSSVSQDVDNVDELDPNVLPDAEILNNGSLTWTKMKLQAPYQFIVSPWGLPQVSYSYGLSKTFERGPIARTAIKALEPKDKMDIAKLKDIFDEANAATASLIQEPIFARWSLRQSASVEHYLPERITEQKPQPEQIRPMRTPLRPQTESAEIHIPLVNAVK